jgi:hypothetical protein
VISSTFLVVALSKIKREIKHNSEMLLNQKMMGLHITMVGLTLFVEIVLFSVASYYASKGKPAYIATFCILLFISLNLIQVIIVVLFLKLANPSPNLVLKDSFISNENDQQIKGYAVHYYARDG